MIAVVGGLGAALAWALATLAAARASRVLGPWSTTALVVFIGLLVTLPLVALQAPSEPISQEDLLWLMVAGLGYAIGMIFNYTALAGGKVPVTAPIVSTEGSIAAALAVLTGEAASPLLAAMLVLIAVGIFVVALQPGGGADVLAGGGARYIGYAVIAAMIFGVGLYGSGRASEGVPPSLVVLAGRVAGVALLTVPLALTRRLRFERSMWPFLVFAAVAEVVGVYLFAVGAAESIAVTGVLSSQFAVIAALLAHALGERISPRQWVGVAAVTTGVVVITLIRL
jgi:drug/metabolite transporter (DMT)-like permease